MVFFAALFSGAVALGNYQLFEPLSVLEHWFDLACCLLGGFSIGYAILLCLLNRLPLPARQRRPGAVGFVFCFVFLSVAVVDLGYLCFVRYPGVLTTDSYSTIRQILGLAPYNNVMPYWHTVTVELFFDLGMLLFHDINAAVACFHGAQILFLAAAVAGSITTMYQVGVPWPMMAVCYGIYTFLPYHIVYSITLWKDVPFAGAALLLIIGLYRLLKNIGQHRWLNWLTFLTGVLGFCLLRTNGWFAFAAVTVWIAVLLRRRSRNLVILMVFLLVLTWVMIGPVLDHLSVGEMNFVEAFAVPMQQIARVIHNDRPLTDWEHMMLSRIFELDRVKELYDPQIVDPIKFNTFHYSQVPYILDHAGEYLKLYISLGLRYPLDYLKAWIEQTKGYWNGGYCYWTYTLHIGQNSFGIYQTPGHGILAQIYGALFRYLEKPTILQCLTSIGLHTWTLVCCCLLTALKKRKEFFLTIPILVLIFGLWLGAPVFSEFRYAYPMILTLPMIFTATIYGQAETAQIPGSVSQ